MHDALRDLHQALYLPSLRGSGGLQGGFADPELGELYIPVGQHCGLFGELLLQPCDFSLACLLHLRGLRRNPRLNLPDCAWRGFRSQPLGFLHLRGIEHVAESWWEELAGLVGRESVLIVHHCRQAALVNQAAHGAGAETGQGGEVADG